MVVPAPVRVLRCHRVSGRWNIDGSVERRRSLRGRGEAPRRRGRTAGGPVRSRASAGRGHREGREKAPRRRGRRRRGKTQHSSCLLPDLRPPAFSCGIAAITGRGGEAGSARCGCGASSMRSRSALFFSRGPLPVGAYHRSACARRAHGRRTVTREAIRSECPCYTPRPHEPGDASLRAVARGCGASRPACAFRRARSHERAVEGP
jgi:hypothetical protein